MAAQLVLVPWSKYRQWVVTEVEGAPNIVIEDAIRRAVIEFCEYTTYWRFDLSNQPIFAGKHTYELGPRIPKCARIVTPIHVSTNNQPLRIITPEELDILWPKFGGKWPIDRLDSVGATPWRDFIEDDQHFYFMVDNPETIRIFGIPKVARLADVGLKVKVALKPLPDSTEGPEIVFTDFYQTIVYGALRNLQLTKNKPWSDPTLAATNHALFETGKIEAMGKVTRAFMRHDHRPLRVRGYFR